MKMPKEGSKKEEMMESPKERKKEAKAGDKFEQRRAPKQPKIGGKRPSPFVKPPKFKPGGGY